MPASRTALFIGALVVVLAVVAVMGYLGIERLGEIDDTVDRAWREKAVAYLQTVREPTARAWTDRESPWFKEVEILRASDSPKLHALRNASPVVLGFFTLNQDLSPVFPQDWSREWLPFAEVGPRDAEGETLVAKAERLEFAGGNSGKALPLYAAITSPDFGITLRNKARLAAGATAFKLRRFSEAAMFYRMILDDPVPMGIAPWIRAMAAHRRTLCLERAGKIQEAIEGLQKFLKAILSKGSDAASFAGLPPGRRAFLIERALQDLRRLAKSPRDLQETAFLAARWRDRQWEDEVLEAVRVWAIPAIRRQGPSEGRIRFPGALGKAPVLGTVEIHNGEWRGLLLDPSAMRKSVAGMAVPPASPFTLSIRVPGDPAPNAPTWATAPLFPGSDAIRLAASPVDAGAPAREATGRRYSLLGMLALAGIVLFAGTLLVLRRLKKEMELSRLKSGFLAGVSHDFRTPLAIIRSSAETLRMGRVTEPQKVQRYLDVILKEILRLDDFVGNVLEAARIELGRKTYRFNPLDPTTLLAEVENARRLYLEEEGFRFEVDASPSLPTIRADVEALRSALYNLIENAVKYSEEEKAVRLRAFSREGEVVFSVEDRGRGIHEEERKRIFDRFYRSPKALGAGAGTGLGLALVLETVKAHGGRIEVTGREGGGTAFSLALPASMEA
ncbi:MAG: sensor histidine kinase [Planctomycetota bacterium]|jgi:signal transduction histidine kinase